VERDSTGEADVNLTWQGSEHVLAPKDRTWAFINDPAEVAQCLPDVQSVTVVDAHAFDAVVNVAVGPVRGKFTFRVALEPQPGDAQMKMAIRGGGLGSVIDLTANATIAERGDGTTTLDWSGSASMRGPVATIGGRMVNAQAERVITTTFANVKNRLAGAVAP
jgi:hypothetical protein